MNRLLFLGAPARIPLPWTAPARSLLEATHDNTGNLLIGYSVAKQLLYDETESGWLDVDTMRPAEIDERYDALVIPASNFLNPFSDFGLLFEFIKKTNIPVIAIGVGSQAPLGATASIEVKPGTLRFLQLIADRSATIGVRGAFTADCFQALGIKNVEVIGCPSFFFWCERALPKVKRLADGPREICINSDPEFPNNPDLRNIHRLLFKAAMDANATYVVQNEQALAEMALHGDVGEDEQVLRECMNFFCVDEASDEVYQYLRHNLRIYFDIERWLVETAKLDFAVGARFHGNMIAIQAGIPALVLAHDMRTKELCETLKIPHVIAQELKEIDFLDLYQKADIETTAQQYPFTLQRYESFLERNQLQHRLARPYPTMKAWQVEPLRSV